MAAEFKPANHTISIVSAFGLAWALAQAYETWTSTVRRIEDVERRLTAMPPAIAAGNTWTCNDHLIFVYELAKSNPKLVIPHQGKVCQP